MKQADDFITEIMSATKELSDAEYCDFLEEISSALDDAAQAKRSEMTNEN